MNKIHEYVYNYDESRIGIRVWVQNDSVMKYKLFGHLGDLSDSVKEYYIRDAEFQALHDWSQENKVHKQTAKLVYGKPNVWSSK